MNLSLDSLSELLTNGSVDFNEINYLVIGVPFYWFFLEKTINILMKFSFTKDSKSFYPFSSDCFVNYDHTVNSSQHTLTKYNEKEAKFLVRQEIIFHNLHKQDLTKEDFVNPVILTSNKNFDLLELKLFSNDANNNIDNIAFKENRVLSFTPKYVKAKTFLKLTFLYHSESEVQFNAKISLKDGEHFDDTLNLSFKKGERYATFSAIEYGNGVMLLPLFALIPSAILYFLTIVSFKINSPITEKLFINPLSITYFIIVLFIMFFKFRKWKKSFLIPFNDKIWTDNNRKFSRITTHNILPNSKKS